MNTKTNFLSTRIFALLFLLFAGYGYAQSQSWQWAKRAGSVNDNNGNPFNPTGNEMITDVKADKYGNVYATGYFYPNPTFMNATNGLPTTGGYGKLDAYLIKYNSCGKTLWWRRIGSASDDRSSSLLLDNYGRIIMNGAGGATTYTLGGSNIQDTVINTGGSAPGFLARFDTAGHLINIFSGYGGNMFITSQGDYFITSGIQAVRINTLGTVTASYTYALVSGITTTLSGYFPPAISGIALDKNDNIYVSGAYTNTINIGGGTILVPNGGLKSLIMKFSPNGTMLWYKTDNNTNIASALVGCVVDTSGTRIMVGGNAYPGANVFGYVVNVPSNCTASTFYWLDAATGNLISGITGTVNVASVASLHPHYTDRDDSVHFKGKIIGSVTFNTTTYTSTAASGGQSCIGKISATSSSFVSINMLPQSGSLYEQISALDVDEQGNVYIAGMFGGTLDSAGTAVNIIGGTEDGFIAKYGFACNTNSTTLSPLPPTSLTAQYQATLSNHVTWVDNAQYENSYELWYTVNSSPTFSLLTTLPANTITYTHTGLSYTTTYCYKARAVNNIGASFFTNVGCVTTPATPTNTNGTAPNTPLNLTATNNGSLSNNVTWTDNSNNEDNFELHYTISSSTTYSLLATLPPNTTSYAHTGLTHTTTYCYKVAATNSVGTSAFSNTACASTPDNGTGVAEQNLLNSLSVYPNPTSGEITLRFVSTGSKTKVEVFDLTGKIVYTEIINTTQGENTRKFNLPKEKGLYAVKLSSEQAVVTRKIVVE